MVADPPRYCLRFLGVVQILYAGFALWLSATSFVGLLSTEPSAPREPYFWHAYGIMSAVCVAFHVTLALIGVSFVRMRTRLVSAFVAVMITEVVYFIFAVGPIWSLPGTGAASAIANGGLFFQVVTLFPLWGSLIASWVKRRIEPRAATAWELRYPGEQIARPNDWVFVALNFVVLLFLVALLVMAGSERLYPGTRPPAGLRLGIAAAVSAANAALALRIRRRMRRKRIERRWATRLRAGVCPRCE